MRTFEEKVRVLEARCGRDWGWFVEWEGRRLAQLTEPREEDMFLYSYRVEMVSSDPEDREFVFGEAFWDEDLVFRNRETGEVASEAFPGAGPPGEEGRMKGRIYVRCLLLDVKLNTIERFLLWRLRRREAMGG